MSFQVATPDSEQSEAVDQSPTRPPRSPSGLPSMNTEYGTESPTG